MEGETLFLVGDQACSGEPDPVEGQAALNVYEFFSFPHRLGFSMSKVCFVELAFFGLFLRQSLTL